MSNEIEADESRRPGRTVCGPAISNFMFFDVSEAAAGSTAGPLVTAALRLNDRQEVWLESCGVELNSFEGKLEIFPASNGTGGPRGRLSRTASFEVSIYLQEEELAVIVPKLVSTDGPVLLMVEFDVEYCQGWESPGGYSPDYGVRYWDDVLYPQVAVDRYRFE